jgi:hypothetical protein
MAHEFKPGDLALVVLSRTGLNLGKCVTVERRVAAGERVNIAKGVDLLATVPAWLVSGELEDVFHGQHLSVKQHAFEDRGLMPLKGDEQPAQVRQAERVQ